MANSNGLATIKYYLSTDSVKSRFNEILGKKSAQFMASVTNAVSGSAYLRDCDQQSVLGAAFIAASLDLPIDPNLGRAYIIPYGKKAQFQIGYKGFIELAIRTGQYKDMNSTEVYEDEILEYNPILGKLRFVDDFTKCTQREAGQTDKIVGYYAYYELLTGFSKGLYMTKQQIINHAQKYSVAYQKGKKDSPWFTNFDEMAKKTVIKRLLSKWAVLSVEMQTAITQDQAVYEDNGNAVYADNIPESDPVDQMAEDVTQKLLQNAQEPQNAEKEKSAEKVPPKQEKPVDAPVNVPNDFAEFEANFMPEDLPFA